MTWKIENTDGKQWRIESPDGRWSMQPEGEISADEARTVCELATKNAQKIAILAVLVERADLLRSAQRTYGVEKSDRNSIAVAFATMEYDRARKALPGELL